ncbi:MAG: type II toxin-antitoxin system RelE/ParE family toxin [Burkholderiaceae bacterium]|nr:type II toxin-antitoxin system RelE/ParE family toxin [Burkholderiaceae bacterium]
MSALHYEAGFLRDLDRIVAHLEAHEADDIAARVADLLESLELLQRHPLIGRAAQPPRRELVIGQGGRGYVALYRYDPLDDMVVVLGLRAQREAGFAG